MVEVLDVQNIAQRVNARRGEGDAVPLSAATGHTWGRGKSFCTCWKWCASVIVAKEELRSWKGFMWKHPVKAKRTTSVFALQFIEVFCKVERVLAAPFLAYACHRAKKSWPTSWLSGHDLIPSNSFQVEAFPIATTFTRCINSLSKSQGPFHFHNSGNNR